MGGPAIVQALHGLIFCVTYFIFPYISPPCSHTQTHGIRLESNTAKLRLCYLSREDAESQTAAEGLSRLKRLGSNYCLTNCP